MAETDPYPYTAQAGDDAILEEMRQRFRTASNSEDARRTQQEFDYKFSIGQKSETESYQWNDQDKAARAGRPMITNNLIAGQIRRLKDQQRESLQMIRANPVDNGADPEKAEVRQGVIRHIETSSDADEQYLTAGDQQIRMGEAYLRVYPRWVEDAEEPEQELVIEAIENRFSVYCDPAAKTRVASDARYFFITEDLEDAEFKNRYPKSLLVGLSEFQGMGDYVSDWFLKGSKRIAEYFYVKSTWTTQTFTSRSGQNETRELERRQVCWIKTNGVEILSRRELPPKVKWIPVVRVAGEKTIVDGKVDFRGIVRDAIQPQKKLNYMDSAEVEMIGIGSKSRMVGYKGQFTDPRWKTANTKLWTHLEVEPTLPGVPGLLPLPTRDSSEPPIQALVIASQRAENNLRAVLGVVDVEAQERHKEVSGRAVIARERQSEKSNSHLVRNLGLGVRQVGRVVNAWMEYVYDSPRVMRIMGADESEQNVMIHSGMAPSPEQIPQDGQKPMKVVDLKVGRYDIVIREGQSAPTARLEARESMDQIVAADPSQLKVMGDLYFGSMDSEWARKLSKRYEKMVPKELRDDSGQPDVQQLQQQLQQMGQMMQQLVQELEAKNEFIKTDGIKMQGQLELHKIDAANKETLERMKNETQLAIEKLKIDFQQATALFTAEQERVGVGRMQAHEAQQAGLDRETETSDAERARQHDTEMGERGHEQAMEQTEQAAALAPEPAATA